jgi:hypothetical protein
MIANVTTENGVTVGRIGSTANDVYMFEFAYSGWSGWDWKYKGKVLPSGPFIPADVQGAEFIPDEFYNALDLARITNSPVEFEDPFDALEVQGA